MRSKLTQKDAPTDFPSAYRPTWVLVVGCGTAEPCARCEPCRAVAVQTGSGSNRDGRTRGRLQVDIEVVRPRSPCEHEPQLAHDAHTLAVHTCAWCMHWRMWFGVHVHNARRRHSERRPVAPTALKKPQPPGPSDCNIDSMHSAPHGDSAGKARSVPMAQDKQERRPSGSSEGSVQHGSE